jgi:hypothetical protein
MGNSNNRQTLREELDAAKRDIRILTGLVHIIGVGTQFCLHDSSNGGDYPVNSGVSATGPSGSLVGLPGKKPSYFKIPSLESMWDAVFSTSAWNGL